MVGYVFIYPSPGITQIRRLLIDGERAGSAVLGESIALGEDHGLFGHDQSLVLATTPGRRSISISLENGETYSTQVDVPPTSSNVVYDWQNRFNSTSVRPVRVDWQDFGIDSTVVLLDGMPDSTPVFVDGVRITAERGPMGYWDGWVGGVPGVGILRGVPQGSHTIVTGPEGGLRKTFENISVRPSRETVARRFSSADGFVPAGVEVTRVAWDQRPFDTGSVVGGGEDTPPDQVSETSYTISVSPASITVPVGQPVSASFEVSTRALGAVGDTQVSLTADGGIGGNGDLDARHLDVTIAPSSARVGETFELRVTGPAQPTPGVVRVYLKARGPGAPATPVSVELRIEAGLQTSEDEGGQSNQVSTVIIAGVLVAVAAVGFVVVSSMNEKNKMKAPRENPSRKRRMSRR